MAPRRHGSDRLSRHCDGAVSKGDSGVAERNGGATSSRTICIDAIGESGKATRRQCFVCVSQHSLAGGETIINGDVYDHT